jgi:RNA polymerase sigma-70 factor (ECF subfamily)
MSVNQQNVKLDSNAFDQLHRAYSDRLQASVLNRVRNREEAEDITAAAFESAFEHRESFRAEAAQATWLHAIAFNKIRRAHARNATVSLDALGESSIALTAPDRLEETQQRLECCARLRCSLRQIPAIHRRVLLGHFVQGHSVRQIAKREGIPVGTVLSRIFAAKRLLREAWDAAT